MSLNLDGICATNTTIERIREGMETKGGMSGAPLFEKSVQIVRYISKATEGK